MYKYQHGGNLYEITAGNMIKETDILDFSSNINPLGIPGKLRETLINSIDLLMNYPDPECNKLRNELSRYTGVPKEDIIAGNGASELIYLLFKVLKPSNILMPAPCFAEYARAAEESGTEIRYYGLKEENSFRLDINDFIGHITKDTEAVLICNPNNPTSALIPSVDLLTLLEYSGKHGIKVIIDEAFIELTSGGNANSVSSCLKQYKNLFIIRALTKVLAVPGLRLGYAMGDTCIIGQMSRNKIPWSVNSFACNIGDILTGDAGYFSQTAAWLKQEKEWLYNELLKLPLLKIFYPDTNFILIRILSEDITSKSLQSAVLKKGILIRDASNFKFLGNKFIRVAVKSMAANERLVKALKEVLSDVGLV